MILFDAPVEPDALTTYVREVPAPPGLTLLGEVPAEFEADNTVSWAEITRTNRTARYRSFDGRIHVSKRDGADEKRVPLIPLSDSLSMGEYERLQLQFARTGGTRTEALAAAIYDDATILTRHVLNRLEQALGDLLTDGKLTINENGYQGEADFGVPAGQLVAPATLWTDTTNATVLTNLITWFDVWKQAGADGVLRTSQRVIRLMQQNKQIIDAVHGATQGRTRVTLTELNDLLASEGLPTLAPAYDGQVDVDGVTTRTIPDDRLLFTPRDLGDLTAVKYGVSATALELVGSNRSEMDFEEAPGIVGVVIKEGPPFRQYTFVDAAAMPVLKDARRLLVADVA